MRELQHFSLFNCLVESYLT